MTLALAGWLCSALFYSMVSSNRLRVFRYNGGDFDITEALRNCKLKNEWLVTVFDEEDASFIVKYTNTRQRIWLGLWKERSITWSDGANVTFTNSSVNLRDNQQICEAIENNTWRGFNCSDKKPFMCYKGNKYTPIEEKMDWCHALHYCRHHFTDLVSIRNETQNREVIKKGNNRSFWIGLMHDEWEWADNSCSSYREWDWPRRGGESKCTTTPQSRRDQLLSQVSCTTESTARLLCSKGNVRIKVIELKLTWEQANDYCKANHTGLLQIMDEDDQFAVKQWLEHSDVDGQSFWIGLRQACGFGFWIWSDRTASYSNWMDGKQPEMPISKQCGVITSNNFTWSNEDCLVPRYFLCEEKIIYLQKDRKG